MAYIPSDVIINILKGQGQEYPYAAAFGACWAVMTNEQREQVVIATSKPD